MSNSADHHSSTSTPTTTGAVRYGKRRHGLAWVPWVALLLLALTAALTYLVLQNVNDNNDKAGIDLTDDEVGVSAPVSGADDNSVTSMVSPYSGDTSSSSNGTSSSSSGSFSNGTIRTTSGTDLLSLAESSTLTSVVGQNVSANNVLVRSVVANEGFWVGTETDQIFVHLAEQAKGVGESAVQVAAGQRVDVEGTATRIPSSVATLGVTADEGAQQLMNQGAYLEAVSFAIK